MSKNLTLPPKASRLKSLLRLQRFVKNPIPFLNDNIKKFGETYCFSLRNDKVGILTIDPDIIQHMLRKNNTNYEKPIAQSNALAKFIGNGILVSTGDYHDEQRDLIAPGMHRKQLDYVVSMMNDEMDLYLDNMSKNLAQNNAIELTKEMKSLTFRVMAKCIYGKSLSLEGRDIFEHNFGSLQVFFANLVRWPFLLKWYNVNGKTKTYTKVAEKMRNVIFGVIENHKKDIDSHNDMLAMLMGMRYADGSSMTPQQLMEESIILFVAGHETATSILSWMVYLLEQHPDKSAKIQAEIDAFFPDGVPTFEGLIRMEYLTQFINEALRLYPPSWITDRVAIEDDNIKGFDIPKGAIVIPFIYGLHHNEKIWPNPLEFRPERFAKEERKARHNFAHIPFGAGPRQCIGRNFAMMEMQMILIKFIQRFNLKLAPGQEIGLLPQITLQPRNGIKMELELKE